MALVQDWRVPLGTRHTDEALGVVVDSAGNIVVAGYTTGEFVRDGQRGGYDAWVIKLSAGGKELWRHQFGTAQTDQALALALDYQDNIVLAGYTTGEMVAGEARGGYDAWLAKFSPDGQELWRHQVGTPAEDSAYSVACDAAGNVLLAGCTAGDMLTGANQGGFDAWVARFAPDGAELWRQQIGTGQDDDAHSVVADAQGNVIVGGYTSGELVAGQRVGGYDAWLAKLSPAGQELWRHQIGSVMGDRVYSVTVDSADHVLVTGHTAGAMVPGQAQGGYDAWVAKFDPEGREVWRQQVGTSANDDARSVAVNRKNQVVIVGYTISPRTNNANVWVVKFDSDGREVWREHLKAVDNEAAHCVTIDAADHLLIAGYTTRPDSPFTSAWVAKFHEGE